ncbi:hypothetical protein D3C72_1071070 [compost metagenome]
MNLVPITAVIVAASVAGCQVGSLPATAPGPTAVPPDPINASSVTRPESANEATASPVAVAAASQPIRVLPLRHIDSDAYKFRVGPTAQVAFRSQADVDTFLWRHSTWDTVDYGHLVKLPTIDFTKEIGILVIAPSESFVTAAEVVAVEEYEDRLYVRSVHWVPGPHGIHALAASQPSQYIAIPRIDKPIVFAPMETVPGGDGPRQPRKWEPNVPL